jgi:hypothetical protein
MDRIPRTFGSFLWSVFLDTQALIIDLCILLVGLVVWWLSANEKIPTPIALPILVISVILICTFAIAAFKLFISDRCSPPKVRTVIDAASRPEGAPLLFILEPSEHLTVDVLVSFYFTDENEAEHRIGVGVVSNIQDNDLVQVEMIWRFDHYEALIEKLARNDVNVLRKVKVKPGIPKGYLALIFGGV